MKSRLTTIAVLMLAVLPCLMGAVATSSVPTVLGTPASGTLTNCTGLPVATGISGLGAGVATALATPSSANLAGAITDETGSGSLVFGTSPTITGGSITGVTTLTASSGGSLGFASRSLWASPSDGVTTITNNAGTDFTLLQFGGTTSSFPAIKRVTSSLQCRLANDSDYCNLQSKNFTANGTLTQVGSGSATTIGSATINLTGLPTADPTGSTRLWNSGGLLVFGDLDASAARSGIGANDASNLSSGTLAAARGGAGTVSGMMKANGSGTVSAATAGTDYYKSGSTTSGPVLISCFGAIASPADATNYYSGQQGNGGTGSVQMATTVDRRSFVVPFACTITKAYVRIINDGGTAGSNETSTISVRLNNTTDTSLSTAIVTNANGTFASGALSISVAAGDTLEIKWLTPTWATNPTNVNVQVAFEVHP